MQKFLEHRIGDKRMVRLLMKWMRAGVMEDARARCELLRASVAAYPWEQVEPGLAVTISVGLAEITDAAATTAAMNQADQRLYDAKRNGRNRVEAY